MNNQEIGFQDSLKKRYAFKLSTNLVGFFISLVTNVLIPRGLGPKAFGDFSFLTNFFSQLMSFFEMGTSTAYYTKLSQRPKDTDLVRFYSLFAIIISLAALLCVFFTHWRNIYIIIWPDQGILFIYLAAGLGIITWSTGILNQMVDAYGLTVPAEKVRMGQKVIGLLLIAALFFGHLLQLTNYFLYNYLIMLLLAFAFIAIMTRNDFFSLSKSWVLPWNKIKIHYREFYSYSYPLFALSLISFLANIFDRWLLQFFSGSVQQGFYGLSYQIGVLCFLFTSAMTPLLTREFSIAHHNNDLELMASLFRRYVPLLYSIAAFFACFIAVQADKVAYIIGGKSYKGAMMAVAVMALYPLHQTYGQLTGSVFFATGETRLYGNIGIIFLLAGLPLTYFLIAPAGQMGLNAGATGLALKMVLINVISVNTVLYFATKILHLNFWRYLGHQAASFSFLIVVAAIVAFTTDYVFQSSYNIVFRFFVSGIIYTVITVGMVIIYPGVFGLKRKDVKLLQSEIKSAYLDLTGRKR